MEAERKARELAEKERLERAEKIKDQFADPNGQWEKDKTDIHNEALKEKAAKEKAAAQGVAADSKPAVAGPAKPEENAQGAGSQGVTQVIRTK
jgi:mannan polymerase II complex ANP1 subunit